MHILVLVKLTILYCLTVFVPRPFHLIGRSRCTPSKIFRERVVVNTLLMRRGSATPTQARVTPKESVLFNQLGIKSSRGFGSSSPFGVGEINMIESKFFAESPWPFKVVHKRPCCVPSDVTAVEYDSYTKYVLYEI